jgi:site-specific recombinase XerD
LHHFKTYTKGKKVQFKSIDDFWVQSFKNYLLSVLKPNTANTYFIRLKIVWKCAIAENITTRNPFKALKMNKVEKPKREFLTFEDIKSLANTPTDFAPVIRQAFLFAWASKAGITKDVHFHIARHTFATLALTFGGDIFTVSKLLGHADLKTTQVYAKLIDSKKREVIDKVPQIDI